MEKLCIVCECSFTPTNNRQKICPSKECRQRVKNDRRNKHSREELENIPNRKCIVCDEEFSINSRQITKVYCSENCSNKAERLYGDKKSTDIDYKNKIRFSGNRFKALERDNYECQMCNNVNQLIVHHVDCSGQSDNPNNDLDNLLTLCRSCHINLHRILDKMET